MPRVKGNTVPMVSFKVGAGASSDFGADVVSIEFTDGAGGAVTMSDFATGVAPVQLNLTFVLDLAATASFEYFTANAGASGVSYEVRLSNAARSQTNPGFVGTLTIDKKPRFKIDAGDATATATYDVSYALDSWTKVVS